MVGGSTLWCSAMHRLDQARRAGRGLRVADLRLHRARARTTACARPAVGEHRAQRLELGRVAGLRAGAVRLDQLHGLGAVARSLVRAAQRQRLALGARRVDALRAPVRRRADAADHGVDRGRRRARRPRAACSASMPMPSPSIVPSACVGERPAVAGRRQCAGVLREAHEHQDVVQRVDAAGDARGRTGRARAR